ncbi:winged helix-turn-helix domain-containing protein [Micromonospora purpureochromogenes]|uniref:AfsR/SARP family transcriptional regulator n=1 Tax=Micromonospora purpureochromogenes TaxID=47872 RepID=UPI003640545D
MPAHRPWHDLPSEDQDARAVRGSHGRRALADVPGARLRGLLIALALEPGRVVSKATLVDWIWGEHPPADATNALHRLVSRLRKALPEGSVEGQPDGYRLAVEPDAVDVVRFERLVTAGQVRNDGAPRARSCSLSPLATGLWMAHRTQPGVRLARWRAASVGIRSSRSRTGSGSR